MLWLSNTILTCSKQNQGNAVTCREVLKLYQFIWQTLPLASRSNSLQWCHNGRDGVSNHQPHECLLNRLSRRRSKKTLKLRITGLCAVNLPVTGKFPALRDSNAENVSIWSRHHVYPHFLYIFSCYTQYISNVKWTINFQSVTMFVATHPFQRRCIILSLLL